MNNYSLPEPVLPDYDLKVVAIIGDNLDERTRFIGTISCQTETWGDINLRTKPHFSINQAEKDALMMFKDKLHENKYKASTIWQWHIIQAFWYFKYHKTLELRNSSIDSEDNGYTSQIIEIESSKIICCKVLPELPSSDGCIIANNSSIINALWWNHKYQIYLITLKCMDFSDLKSEY